MLAADLAPWFVRILAFVWGALWGSFFNVAIYRWPLGMSVVSPPSHCPGCQTPIPALRNLPIVGWLLLRGRAACCGNPISPRYPLIELLTALLTVAIAEQLIVGAAQDTTALRASLETLVYFVFVGGLLIATFVDLEWMEIPDEVSLPGAALGLVTAPFRSWPGAIDATLGAGAGFLLVQLVFVWGYERLTGRRGMGEGDAKLLLMIGAFLGLKGALFSLVAGSFQGILYAAFATLTGRDLKPEIKDREIDGMLIEAPDEDDEQNTGIGGLKLPFGPFLALGALEYLFAGKAILGGYFKLVGRLLN